MVGKKGKGPKGPVGAIDNKVTPFPDQNDDQNQTDYLVSIGRESAPFRAPNGTPYAVITRANGSRWIVPIIGTADFTDHLRMAYFERRERKVPGESAIKSALSQLAAIARRGEVHRVHVRVAHVGNIGEPGFTIYIDLGEPDSSRAVEIDALGSRVVGTPPVRFVGSSTMGALPEPVHVARRGPTREPGDDGGINPGVERLRDFFNGSPGDFHLVVAFLVAAIVLKDQFPLLTLIGRGGSAKTSLARLLRSIIDPSPVDLTGLPSKVESLWIDAQSARLLVYDNVSALTAEMSDQLCILTDGGSFSTRAFFSNAGRYIFSAERPVIFTGIDAVVLRGDLAERNLSIDLYPMAASKRRSRRALQAEIDEAWPTIIGGIHDAVAEAIRNYSQAEESLIGKFPRRADFLAVAVAAEGAWTTPGTVAIAFAASTAFSIENVLESDTVATVLRTFLSRYVEQTGSYDWMGTPGALLDELAQFTSEATRKALSWPDSPEKLGHRLRRLEGPFREIGIAITRTSLGRGRNRRRGVAIHVDEDDKTQG